MVERKLKQLISLFGYLWDDSWDLSRQFPVKNRFSYFKIKKSSLIVSRKITKI